MQLSAAVVVFAASLPHAVVRHPVGSFHTEHQVLNEGNLHTENTHQTHKGMEHWEWIMGELWYCAQVRCVTLVHKKVTPHQHLRSNSFAATET